MEKFESIIRALTARDTPEKFSFDFYAADHPDIPRRLNHAFLILLAGRMHPLFKSAKRFFDNLRTSPERDDTVLFYEKGLKLVPLEIEKRCRRDPDFEGRLDRLCKWVSDQRNLEDEKRAAEEFWSVFFPEGCGILENRQAQIEALRSKRKVTVTKLNADPITDPARQMIFTSNVLLSAPPATRPLSKQPIADDLRGEISEIMKERQVYWYDHPVQIGVRKKSNEILYGLKGLEEAFAFEEIHGRSAGASRPVCVLSVSVTHEGLQRVAKRYIEEELARSGELEKMDLYVFTEADTRKIVHEILVPAAGRYLQRKDARSLLEIFGVDGDYGRHYSFLKAVAALWKVFVNPEIRATFKIDLDQVFPQEELVDETGSSALEHFKTPLWGARGIDSNGHPLEMGMIAGALVNKRDICKSLFTPDVPFPDHAPSDDELFFFSTLPQALSTEAEMMVRYAPGELDGRKACLQRIHVTGGTNGILVDSLRRHRPFTPSFMGRAEDQAYILSVMERPGTKLAYVHKDGLMMRHDKEAFAQEAIKSASVGKLIGDYIRIIFFSAYAGVLTNDVKKLKGVIDPFTGCFVSVIPATVVYLRFCFKAVHFFRSGREEEGVRFMREGAKRILKAMDFAGGEESLLRRVYERERRGWDLYYDTISAVEQAIEQEDAFALGLKRKAKMIIDGCAIKTQL